MHSWPVEKVVDLLIICDIRDQYGSVTISYLKKEIQLIFRMNRMQVEQHCQSYS
jgi:hypothetical protein